MLVAGPLRYGKIGTRAWRQAVEAHRQKAVVPDDGFGPLWAASGMFTLDGELSEGWQVLLDTFVAPAVAGVIVARYHDVVFRTELAITRSHAVTVLHRSRWHPATRRSVAPLPTLEVAVMETAGLWPLLRRVLPPEPLLRAAPSRAPARLVRLERPSDWPAVVDDQAIVEAAERMRQSVPALLLAEKSHAEVATVLGTGVSGESCQAMWGTDGVGLLRASPEGLLQAQAGDLSQWHVSHVERLLG